MLNILKQKLKGVADVKRLKKQRILRVKHTEAERGELFSSVWEFVVICSKLEAWWVLTLPKDPNTLVSGERFMVFIHLVVARRGDFDEILIWEEEPEKRVHL